MRLLSGVAKEGETKTVDVPEIERVVARMARIPAADAKPASIHVDGRKCRAGCCCLRRDGAVAVACRHL